MSSTFIKNENRNIQHGSITIRLDQEVLSITGHQGFIFGMGERFDAIDLNQQTIENKVLEKFCHQGKNTYLPLPFFILSEGIGIFIETERIFEARFQNMISIDLTVCESTCRVHVIEGNGKEIIQQFIEISGKTHLPPKWSFGPWLSGHRWNSEALVKEQLLLSHYHRLPFTTLVIEQWSDEATFYIFNEANYAPSNKALSYDDYQFSENSKWPNPKRMINDFKALGFHTLLWQAPVIKKLEPHEKPNRQNEIDHLDAEVHGYAVLNENGTPYIIPTGHWFPGSYIPDFSNQETRKWWFSKHQYLLDIGIEGFKTDGGEFIYDNYLRFSNGKRGYDFINRYSALTIQAYREFLGKDGALFSRAGYVGQQANTIQWAGDQKSEWSEFKAVYNAGISSSLSGQTFWSFDIGGFAGDLPSVELYRRATQMALFTPIMQLHSEPVGGQFALLDASKVMKNDRTPWNISTYHNDPELLEEMRFYYALRMNLLPTIYSWAKLCVENSETMIKHMWVAYPNEIIAHQYFEQYCFGKLLVAPILDEYQTSKTVYLPSGKWRHLITNDVFEGGQETKFDVHEKDMLVFVPEGTALFLNLNGGSNWSKEMTNDIQSPKILTIWLYGKSGSDIYSDETTQFEISWEKGKYVIKGSYPHDCIVRFID